MMLPERYTRAVRLPFRPQPLAAAFAAVSALAAACNLVLGIGDPQLGTPSSGGSSTSGGGSDVGGGGQGGSGGLAPPPPCAPTDPVCTAVDSDCIALVDNSEKEKRGLRIQHVTVFQPEAFASGIENWGIVHAVNLLSLHHILQVPDKRGSLEISILQDNRLMHMQGNSEPRLYLIKLNVGDRSKTILRITG